MEVSGSGRLILREIDPGSHSIKGWVGPRAKLKGKGKVVPVR
jgi:hypothetical protein